MLSIKNITVQVDKKKVIQDLSVSFDEGKNYCIVGKNWSWKSSLALTIMWHPKYIVTKGSITLKEWKKTYEITKMSPYERAQHGIFLAFQHIPEIPGVKVFEFLRSIYDARFKTTSSFLSFKKIIEPLMEETHIHKDFLRRDLNVWFSWWERRKLEILQVRLLEPKYILLDEIDSGLDIDAYKQIAKTIGSINHTTNTFIIITHLFKILEYLPIDVVYTIQDWKVTNIGNKKTIETIKKKWFNH